VMHFIETYFASIFYVPLPFGATACSTRPLERRGASSIKAARAIDLRMI
jgi:hypothetical protein